MDGFIFYILLVVITALASMLCSCLWKNYRNRAFAEWQQRQVQQQQFLAFQQQQNATTARPLVIGIFQSPDRPPFVIRPADDGSSSNVPPLPAAPPAYNEVVSHPEVYPTQTGLSGGPTAAEKSNEELPPPYSELRQ